MRSASVRPVLIAGATAGALALPAGAAQAAVPSAPLPGGTDVLQPLVRLAKAPLVHRDVRLARELAHVRGTHLRHDYARSIRSWPIARLSHHATVLRASLRDARRAAAEARSAGAGAGSAASPALQAIAACESGGNPSAIGGGGQFRGKYQFTYSTWAAVGGSGDPAAAPEAEQDRRAAMLYARAGAGQWPVCGR